MPKQEFVRFEMIDFNGKALSKTVPKRHKDKRVCMYCGALAMGANSEVICFPDEVTAAGCPNAEMEPDWSTEQVLPWACKDEIQVSRVYCTLKEPNIGCNVVPRKICQKMCAELEAKGLKMAVGGELEFTLAKLNPQNCWEPCFDGVDIFATLQNNKTMDFCYEVEKNMLPLGVDILTINAEYGQGQVEITFAHEFGISAADMTATFRTGIKEMAVQHGMRACFMARPFGVEGVGNGGHFNFSLWQCSDGAHVNITNTEGHAGQFLAGVLFHAPALEAFCAPAPPCYTRHGNWAPVVANYGADDRTACVRVNDVGSYMELRLPSAAANPYLVMAATIAAGLDGIEKEMVLPPAKQTAEQGAVKIPTSLEDALQALESDQEICRRLGIDFVRWYCIVKRAEIDAIERRVARSFENEKNEALSAAWQYMYMEYV